MAKLYRYAGLLVKQEVTSGTDSVPLPASNAMLIRNVTWNPIQMTVEERDLVRPYLGNSEDIVMARWVELEFEIELAGAGAAGDLPAYHDALLMAGHSHVVSAGVDVTYTPVSTGFKSATAYFNLDQVLHKSLFMMAKLGIGLDALKIPVFKFSAKGLFVTLADTGAWTPDYSAFVKPVGVNKANSTLSLHGVSRPLVLRALRFGCETRAGREVCGGDFEGELLRSDFGVDYLVPLVADRVRLLVQVEGARPEAARP